MARPRRLGLRRPRHGSVHGPRRGCRRRLNAPPHRLPTAGCSVPPPGRLRPRELPPGATGHAPGRRGHAARPPRRPRHRPGPTRPGRPPARGRCPRSCRCSVPTPDRGSAVRRQRDPTVPALRPAPPAATPGGRRSGWHRSPGPRARRSRRPGQTPGPTPPRRRGRRPTAAPRRGGQGHRPSPGRRPLLHGHARGRGPRAAPRPAWRPRRPARRGPDPRPSRRSPDRWPGGESRHAHRVR